MAVGVALRSFAGAALIGACSLALLVVGLPLPQRGDAITVALVTRLLHTRVDSATIDLNGSRVSARCVSRGRGVSVITVSNGDRLVVHRARYTVPPAGLGARLLVRPHLSAAAIARQPAEVDLAGPHTLYLDELTGRLLRGDRMIEGTTIYDGRRAYRVRLGNRRPLVELLVDESTLAPLGARFDSARIRGWSRLVTGPSGC